MKFWENKWMILLILMLTWGSSFILIKQSIKAFPPMQVGALRLTIAGVAVSVYGIRSFKFIKKNQWFWLILASFFGNFVPMFLFPIAQQKVSSSMAGILDSLVPIFVLLLGFLLFGIKSRKIQTLGALVGFAGAVVLIGNGGEESSNLLFSLLIILATAFYATSALIIDKYLLDIPSLRLSSVVFTIWLLPSLLILYFTGFFGEFSGSKEQLRGLGFVSILGLIGTAAAIILYYKLIQMTSALFASVVTYLIPIVAFLWGILDGEALKPIHIFGSVLILIGIYLINGKEKKPAVE